MANLFGPKSYALDTVITQANLVVKPIPKGSKIRWVVAGTTGDQVTLNALNGDVIFHSTVGWSNYIDETIATRFYAGLYLSVIAAGILYIDLA